MLSRTADHLYWMARYMERAENTGPHARRHLPDVAGAAIDREAEPELARHPRSTAWRGFRASYDEVNAENVLRFMVSTRTIRRRIYSCLRAARENAHAVRGTLTAEMWETLNATWLEMREQNAEQILAPASASSSNGSSCARTCRAASPSAPCCRTTPALHPPRHLLERADNTARILDVKYHILRRNGDEGATDFYQWGALLRSVSAFEVYRKVYRDADHAGARRRTADPAHGHAALAACLRRRHRSRALN
jgi:uncharacterized alpha-E superfamily protein